MIPPTIRRYFRKVMAHPNGAVVHDGDCHIFSSHVCTCGLLHALLPLENNEEIYPKFYEEWGQQESILEELKFGEE